MKAIRNLLIMSLLSAPVLCMAQQQDTIYYKKKVKRTTKTTSATDIIKDTINRDAGPILNDNGSISTTGTIDGRSSTGRKGSDTLTNSSVRKSRKTIRHSANPEPVDTTRRKKKRP
jgi:hypothetical protein